jgi:hypothetical protein
MRKKTEQNVSSACKQYRFLNNVFPLILYIMERKSNTVSHIPSTSDPAAVELVESAIELLAAKSSESLSKEQAAEP